MIKASAPSGQGKVEYKHKDNQQLESLKITFSGDVIVPECPQTIEGVMSICKTVPSMIQKLDDGKGQQLRFILYPLKKMAQIFNHELRIERYEISIMISCL